MQAGTLASLVTLAYLAGHSGMSITKRYIHPQAETVRSAMEKSRGETAVKATTGQMLAAMSRVRTS